MVSESLDSYKFTLFWSLKSEDSVSLVKTIKKDRITKIKCLSLNTLAKYGMTVPYGVENIPAILIKNKISGEQSIYEGIDECCKVIYKCFSKGEKNSLTVNRQPSRNETVDVDKKNIYDTIVNQRNKYIERNNPKSIQKVESNTHGVSNLNINAMLMGGVSSTGNFGPLKKRISNKGKINTIRKNNIFREVGGFKMTSVKDKDGNIVQRPVPINESEK